MPEILGLVELFFQENRKNFENSIYVGAYMRQLFKFLRIFDEDTQNYIFKLVKLATSTSPFEIYLLL